ncbi:uncharacterized protein LOC114250257 isoform X3 [Bombyx mandarina]|uniref:Uncharacterized protein LOC114250257 isoform X3 n=1 Tax=Bombyx mandarina TaxID=7092 RepID=A0A6J2KC46_BOMMA|nr:uncharacterized protein LOC114250257 isoform X3 [Bombyx mandarina]
MKLTVIAVIDLMAVILNSNVMMKEMVVALMKIVDLLLLKAIVMVPRVEMPRAKLKVTWTVIRIVILTAKNKIKLT